MALYVISRVTKYNNKWIRIFNDSINETKDMKEEDLIFIMKSNDITIRNVELDGNQLVGITGSIDKILDKNCFVVLGKVEDKYKLVDIQGKTKLCSVSEVKQLTNQGILQNAKLVKKDGKEFISGIGWEIPEIVEKKEVKKVSKKKRYSDKECEELLKSYGGNIRKLQTFCGKPCYLSSKSNTEHLLWIPSNVTELNRDWSGHDFNPQIRKLEGSLKVIGGSGLLSCFEMFCFCKNLKELDLSNFDTHNVTNMRGMFYSCERLKKVDLSNFDTYNVKQMNGMFEFCESLEGLDLSNFNTHNVIDMGYMFAACRNLEELDLSNFDTHNVTAMFGMFSHCESLKELDVSNFDTHNVTDMSTMFAYCGSIEELDLSSFDTRNVTDMAGMFHSCVRLRMLDISNFKIEDALIGEEINLYEMFFGCATDVEKCIVKCGSQEIIDVLEGCISDSDNNSLGGVLVLKAFSNKR